MLADIIVPVVLETKEKLAAMKDASEKKVERKKLEDFILISLDKAKDGITDQQKIAFFDQILETCLNNLKTEIEERAKGHWSEDRHSDDPHYIYEDVICGIMGQQIFRATNVFEEIWDQWE